MKKFYKHVSIEKTKQGYNILLDRSLIKTPLGNILYINSLDLAEIIKAEWENQGDELDKTKMPMTELSYTLQDKIIPKKEVIINTIIPYLKTEVICYLSPEPEDLHEKQQELWSPIADWFYKATNIKLYETTELLNSVQSDKDLETLKTQLMSISDIELTAMQATISLLGSAVISYAFSMQYIDANTAFNAAFIEEIFQAEQWGLDPATENKHKTILKELSYINDFLNFVA